ERVDGPAASRLGKNPPPVRTTRESSIRGDDGQDGSPSPEGRRAGEPHNRANARGAPRTDRCRSARRPGIGAAGSADRSTTIPPYGPPASEGRGSWDSRERRTTFTWPEECATPNRPSEWNVARTSTVCPH